uniref:DNA-directed RNA polymerase n=1 Tax=Xylochloris irregularis TaxID=480381 RepID=A0A097KME7_9CHLO|nr:beta subunit of RNA polymerase [Xylochloris irregularis]AIT94340.1 beta subunit of RNA polymerase [Xylochloris irregularis]
MKTRRNATISKAAFFFIRDFVEVQRVSFWRFLEKGLIQELSKRNPIKNSRAGFQLCFYSEHYQLKRPELTSKEAILRSRTYSSKVFVPVQVSSLICRKATYKWVLIGHLPLMTKRGHFVINGSPRVVVNQLVRSPGVYYSFEVKEEKEEFTTTQIRVYSADIIPIRGTWLRLEMDKKKRVWARMKKTPRMSMLAFLQALGYSKGQVERQSKWFRILQRSQMENHPSTVEEAGKRLLTDIRQQRVKRQGQLEKVTVTTNLKFKQALDQIERQISETDAMWYFYNRFGNPLTYQLGKLGRFRVNAQIGNQLPLSITFLTPSDIFLAAEGLISRSKSASPADDIDNLKNRRVRPSGEMVQTQWEKGLLRLERLIRKGFRSNKRWPKLERLITTKPVNGCFREFFGSSPLSQYMDQINPLAEITHKRRVSFLGPGGVNRDTASIAVRGIHPTYYGRICPIETPEGRNAGLVNSLTIHARTNRYGTIETPFFKVYHGQTQLYKPPLFISAEKEEAIKTAPGDLNWSKLHFLGDTFIPVKLENTFDQVFRDRVDLVGVSPIQMISIATSLIPFLEHDDANRALMGSNMQRQALPLLIPERPLTQTGLEGRSVIDSGHSMETATSGYVSYVSSQKIIVLGLSPPV